MAAKPTTAPEPPEPPATLPPALLSQAEAARYLGIGKTKWFALRSAGALPKAVTVPGFSNPYWRRTDLDAWVSKLKAVK